ncbi:MAG: RNA polymerase sigma factor [Myxococcaceae bacterium]|nr:RNA polymerase sigma factor [Myxococcaceae bacterium]
MERFCAGDSQAFDALFARHAGAVRGFLRRLTQSEAAADDLTQLTFLSLVRARGRFLAGARFKPWLYAIAANAAKDHRRRGAHETLPGDDALPVQVADAAPVRDLGLEKRVREALEQLPEAQREAILLHRFQGLSFAEIAEQAGVTESAVKVRAHRGYERLRELLGDLAGELS